MDSNAHHPREIRQEPAETQLEGLLRELLREAMGDRSRPVQTEAPALEVAELRDLARRLRASVHWVPLPQGRNALRRALVTTARRDGRNWDVQTPARPRLRWQFMVGAAAALVLGGFGLRTGAALDPGSPSHPWYGVRIAFEDLRVALVPSPANKAEMLVRATRARIAEIEAMASAGDARGLRRAADALDGEAGWLHRVIVVLPAEDQKRVEMALANI